MLIIYDIMNEAMEVNSSCVPNYCIQKGKYKRTACNRHPQAYAYRVKRSCLQLRKQKMSLSNLLHHLAILSTLSIAALGQNDALTSECLDAVTNFTQDSVCFGSEEGLNGFRAALNSASSSITNSMEGLNDPAVLQAVMTFYDNLCTSQDCVNSYADVIDICLSSTLAQVRTFISLYAYMIIIGMYVIYIIVYIDVESWYADV